MRWWASATSRRSRSCPRSRTPKRNCELAALVSDDAGKLAKLARRYRVEARAATTRVFDELLASGEVDAVYIALPNDMHREYTLRAARAGVHVLCEKPLASPMSGVRAR